MRALVTGISGQDGHYMALLLARHSIPVLGLSSRPDVSVGPALDGVQVMGFDYAVQGRIADVIEQFEPTLIFNFAAKATGQGMFDAPFEMSRINGQFVLDILEAMRHSPRSGAMTFCQASSAEMFGDVDASPQNESTAFRPKSPYGAAKLYAHNLTGLYRRTYGLRCASAILYNHESVRRSEQFVTKKIARAAARIRLGLESEVPLGNLRAQRDWGYAPEYMDALYRMASADAVEDYIVATGRLNTIEHICEVAFSRVGLDYRDHVRSGAADFRAADSVNLCGNAAKIYRDLGWKAQVPVEAVIEEMVDHELRS